MPKCFPRFSEFNENSAKFRENSSVPASVGFVNSAGSDFIGHTKSFILDNLTIFSRFHIKINNVNMSDHLLIMLQHKGYLQIKLNFNLHLYLLCITNRNNFVTQPQNYDCGVTRGTNDVIPKQTWWNFFAGKHHKENI